MNGAQRIEIAAAVETRILDYLNSTGWQAFPFGQALLSPECRDLLWKFEDLSGRPTLIRWMPDIITFGTPRGAPFVALIDAKGTARKDTTNYAVEISSVDAAMIFTDHMYTPTFFAFEGGTLLTPREISQRGKRMPGRPRGTPGNGSGTGFYLVDKQFARPFSDVFPAVVS